MGGRTHRAVDAGAEVRLLKRIGAVPALRGSWWGPQAGQRLDGPRLGLSEGERKRLELPKATEQQRAVPPPFWSPEAQPKDAASGQAPPETPPHTHTHCLPEAESTGTHRLALWVGGDAVQGCLEAKGDSYQQGGHGPCPLCHATAPPPTQTSTCHPARSQPRSSRDPTLPQPLPVIC